MSSKSCHHVMASYSWTCKVDHVIRICEILKTGFGLDIWRDETGSSILPPMLGHADERMAEAVDLSDWVIIFVSRSYKIR